MLHSENTSKFVLKRKMYYNFLLDFERDWNRYARDFKARNVGISF